MTYQSFETAGDSDSSGKLARLQLPGDMTGLAVLDVACNEGFFCQEAWRRGAQGVVGIDKNPEFIERARGRDSRTQYRVMDFSEVSTIGDQFDLVLLLSAMHYAFDPQRLLIDILNLLKPEGLFVLECGVAPGRKAEWVSVPRPVGDVVKHPTHAMLMKALKRASVREIGASVDQVGDPIHRRVYHARPLKPIVLLVSGPSGSGKSTLLKTMSHGGNLIPMNLDTLLDNMPEWCADETLLDVRNSQQFGSDQLFEVVHQMTEAGVEEAFVDQVLATQRVFSRHGEPGITVIEGYALSQGNFRDAFTRRLQALGCYVWHVEPAGSTKAEGDVSTLETAGTTAVSEPSES